MSSLQMAKKNPNMERITSKNKVFGRRKGKRLSWRQKENIKLHLSKYSIFNSYADGSFELDKIDLKKLFGDLDGFELEIGFGMGDFLFQKAMAQSTTGFLGCEVFENGVASLLTRIEEAKLRNVFIHPGNCIDLLDNLRGANLNTIHLLFPDPWPKNRHHKRRFLTTENIDKICLALKKGGSIFIATDIEEYANQISLIMDKRSDFEAEEFSIKEFKAPLGAEFQTKFERKAFASDRLPKYMIFKRIV